MTTIKTVALAGASGNIGSAIIKALLNAGFSVSALTRPGSAQSFPPEVKVVDVDYEDMNSVNAALKGQDALVSAVGYMGILGQKQLVDAAILNGVKRIIPSEYGADQEVAAARQLPVFGHKVQVEHYIKEKVQGTSTTYTLVCNNAFFDWDLDHKFSVDIPGKKMEIFDGGDVSLTVTPLDFVARGVTSVLQHPDETANRVVRLHGASITMNRLLETVQRYAGKDGWSVSHASTEDREREAYGALGKDPADFVAWAIPMLQCTVWGRKFGGDFSQHNDNALLGLKELSDAEIEEIVRRRAES